MKIALINPPYLVIYRKLNIEQSASIPLGLLCVASALEQKGHEVKIVDMNLHETLLPELTGILKAFAPDIIGLTAVTPTINSCQEIISNLRKEFGDVSFVIGGPHVSALPGETMDLIADLDFVIRGEGEYAFCELADALEHKTKDFSSLKGLCWRKNGNVVVNEPGDFIEDLDALPYPAYHLVEMDKYSPSVVYDVAQRSTFIMSSRGCEAYCTFCSNHVTGRKIRVHSVDYFVGMIKHIIEKYGIKHFHLVDDNFMADENRVRQICNRIIDEQLGITWFIFARTDHCQNIELLELIKKAGCVFIQFGIESGSDVVLKQLGKKITKDLMYQACMNCKKVGIAYFNSFMIGGPKETKKTVKETLEYAKKLDAFMSGFNILIPYPGIAIFNKYYKQDLSHNLDWSTWNHITHSIPIDYTHTELTKQDLDGLRKWVIKKYFLRPRQIYRILTSFRSYSLMFKFVNRSWKHLFFLFFNKG